MKIIELSLSFHIFIMSMCNYQSESCLFKGEFKENYYSSKKKKGEILFPYLILHVKGG